MITQAHGKIQGWEALPRADTSWLSGRIVREVQEDCPLWDDIYGGNTAKELT